MPPIRSNKAEPEERWEELKETIRTLYLTDSLKLEGVEGVMSRMEHAHGFHATKAQYGRHFKEWGFQKYRKNPQNEWSIVARMIAKRKRDGKESEVYMDNQKVSVKKVKKECSRYHYASHGYNESFINETLPPCIQVTTPKPIHNDCMDDTNPLATPLTLTTSFDHYSTLEFANLPGSSFEDEFLNIGYTLSPNWLRELFLDISCPSSSVSTPVSLQPALSPVIGNKNVQTPSFEFPTVSLDKSFLFSDNTIGEPNLTFDPAFVKLMVFLAANNLCHKEPGLSILRAFARLADSRMLDTILPPGGPVSKAFTEKSFSHAVEAENINLVKALLERGASPSKHKVNRAGVTLCALSWASNQRNLELVKILVKAGARPEIMFNIDPLTCAISPNEWVRGPGLRINHIPDKLVDMKLIRLLVQANNKLFLEKYDEMFDRAIEQGHLSLIEFLLSNGKFVARSEYILAFKFYNLTNCRSVDNKSIVEIGQALLNAGADIYVLISRESLISYEHSGFLTFIRDYCIPDGPGHSLIDLAAFAGQLQLFELLYTRGVKLSSNTLAYALESMNYDLIQYILQIKNEQDSLLLSGHGIELSLALKLADEVLVGQLLNWGVTPKSVRAMETAIVAAAKTGQRETLSYLMNSIPERQKEWIETISLGQSAAVAIAAGQLDTARFLIESGVVITRHAIEEAISIKDTVMTHELLRRNPKGARSSFKRLLSAAIDWGDYLVIGHLIEIGVGFDRITVSDWPSEVNLLNQAIMKKDLEIVEILVDAGIDLKCSSPPSPLVLAIQQNSFPIVQFLLEAGVDPHDESALHEAVHISNIQMVQLLLKAYKKRYRKCRRGYIIHGLIKAIKQRNLDIIEVLIAFENDYRGILQANIVLKLLDVNNVMDAAMKFDRSNELDIIRKLLKTSQNDRDNDYNERAKELNEDWIISAIKFRNLPAFKLLIELGASIHQNMIYMVGYIDIRITPLQLACKEGFLEAVQLLLQMGVDANSPAFIRNAATALQYAAIGGHVGIAILLLEKGANVNAPGSRFNGRTALEGAAEHGRINMLELLIDYGACLDDAMPGQYSRALMLAAHNQHFAAKQFLESARVSFTADSCFLGPALTSGASSTSCEGIQSQKY